jgi:DNA-binding LacI/PurR family transcriptional regulator
VPIVLLNNQHPSKFVHSVTIDNIDGGYQATRHLIQLGHRRIAYLGDRFGLESDTERFKGFHTAMAEAGLRTPKAHIARGDGKADGGRERAAELLALKDRPSAIFCYNDMTTLGVMEQAAKMRMRVPRDLSVVGFDDLFFAASLQPPLTTIRQPKKELGQRAMELLMALLKGEQAEKTIVIQGELVLRASTARPYQSISAGKNSATRSR